MSPGAVGAVVASRIVVDACQGIDVARWRKAGWRVLSLTGDHAGSPGDDPAALAAFRTAERESSG